MFCLYKNKSLIFSERHLSSDLTTRTACNSLRSRSDTQSEALRWEGIWLPTSMKIIIPYLTDEEKFLRIGGTLIQIFPVQVQRTFCLTYSGFFCCNTLDINKRKQQVSPHNIGYEYFHILKTTRSAWEI